MGFARRILKINAKNITLNLLNQIRRSKVGVVYYTCDCCGNEAADCTGGSCDCNRRYCEYCMEKIALQFDDHSDTASCIYCRGEDFDDKSIFEYALSKLNQTKEELKSELQRSRK